MQYQSEGQGAVETRDHSPWTIAERHNDPRALHSHPHFAHLRMRLLDFIYQDASPSASRVCL